MRISQLVANLECEVIGPDCDVQGLQYDSRLIQPGELFFAIRGFKVDGHEFVQHAVDRGAVAVVVEEQQSLSQSITQIIVSDSRVAMGEMAAAYYGYPGDHLRVIGITGTNGKTTTTYLIKAILQQAGYKVGLIGTIQNLIGTEVIPAKRTTPESLDLQRLLAEMVAKQVDYVVMEVSSHALELKRTAGLEFDIGVFTNLTQDHLDFHHDFSHYFQAKSRLFTDLARRQCKTRKAAVINFDDSFGLQMAAQSSAPVYSYGVNQYSQFHADNIAVTPKGVKYDLVTPLGSVALSLQLTGKFNIYNSLAASAACFAEGVSLQDIKIGLESVSGVPGRFELVNEGQDFTVLVDYAHTPDSMANVLQTARNLTSQRVIVVFGAGGDRDRTKRPLMGEVAARYSDYAVITSDNPRSEDPEQICRDIEQGIPHGFAYTTIINRSQAIEYAIRLAKPGDVVIIAGKGHETYQEFADRTIAFDDRAEARRVLKEL